MGKSKHQDVDINLQQFFAHVFDRDGRIVEPSDCDTAFYLSKLESTEMDEATKVELIHSLWRTLDGVIRLQFGFDSLTNIMNEKAQMHARNDVSMVEYCPIQQKNKDEDA